MKEKALADCVWWTRFGRSYGPVANRLRDDDDDDTNMSPIQGRSLDTVAVGRNGKRLPTNDSAVHCHYTKVPYSYCTQLWIILQFTASLNVISFSLSVSNFTYLYWSLMATWTTQTCQS